MRSFFVMSAVFGTLLASRAEVKAQDVTFDYPGVNPNITSPFWSTLSPTDQEAFLLAAGEAVQEAINDAFEDFPLSVYESGYVFGEGDSYWYYGGSPMRLIGGAVFTWDPEIAYVHVQYGVYVEVYPSAGWSGSVWYEGEVSDVPDTYVFNKMTDQGHSENGGSFSNTLNVYVD